MRRRRKAPSITFSRTRSFLENEVQFESTRIPSTIKDIASALREALKETPDAAEKAISSIATSIGLEVDATVQFTEAVALDSYESLKMLNTYKIKTVAEDLIKSLAERYKDQYEAIIDRMTTREGLEKKSYRRYDRSVPSFLERFFGEFINRNDFKLEIMISAAIENLGTDAPVDALVNETCRLIEDRIQLMAASFAFDETCITYNPDDYFVRPFSTRFITSLAKSLEDDPVKVQKCIRHIIELD